MPHPRFRGEEIARRGEEIYEQRLRSQVETEDNIGKLISIDIENGQKVQLLFEILPNRLCDPVIESSCSPASITSKRF